MRAVTPKACQPPSFTLHTFIIYIPYTFICVFEREKERTHSSTKSLSATFWGAISPYPGHIRCGYAFMCAVYVFRGCVCISWVCVRERKKREREKDCSKRHVHFQLARFRPGVSYHRSLHMVIYLFVLCVCEKEERERERESYLCLSW